MSNHSALAVHSQALYSGRLKPPETSREWDVKLIIIADVHGNIEALDSILEREADADRIICAGDLVDCGPFPEEVIARVREAGIESVRGNHDRKVIEEFRNPGAAGGPDGQITFTAYCAERLRQEDIRFLDSLPGSISFCADGVAYGVRHDYAGYRPVESREAFDRHWSASFDPSDLPRRMIMGHVHRRQSARFGGGRLLINPGAVSFNRPDVAGTRYVAVTDGVIQWKQHPYPKRRTLRAFRAISNLSAKERVWLEQFYPFHGG